MQRVKISLLCLLSLSWAGVLMAQTAVDPNADVGSASVQDFSGGATLRGTYFDVRHMSGNGVGYQSGYTQIGAFTPFWLNDDAFIASNARIILTDNSEVGVNAGAVARHYNSNQDRILGINAYYDSDVTKFGNRYNQLGIGVESLGQFFDIRANGYVPTGEDKTIIGPVGLSNTPFFFENRIGFIGTRLMEQALRGGDIEAGVPVTPQTPWLRAFGGAYAYQQDGGTDPVGVRARLEAWVSNDLSLGVTTTWDQQFGTNVNFVADWRFAGFAPTRYFPQWTTRERMLMPVQRQWRVTAGNFNEEVNVLAINPRDNQPYFVVWVDNSAGGTNVGTFENPYNTSLTHAVPNETDLVLVRRGNTTELAPLNGSMVLPDFARMLGEGKPHIFDAYGDFGPFHVAINDQVLPDAAFNDPANANRFPFLTNTDAGLNGGDIIRVSSHNEVSAFVLEGATGRAIFGNATPGNDVAGFNLNCLEITNNLGGGIRLVNATGTGPVTADGQTINGGVIRDINRTAVVGWSYAGPPHTGLGDNLAGGIFVDTGAAGLNLTMTNVSMNANPASQLFGINLQADDGPLTTTLTNIQANGVAPGAGNTTAGIILGETGRNLIATLTNVSASDNTGDGLQITGTNGSILATITDSASVFNGNGGSGIVYTQTGGTGTLDMTAVQANDNGLDGLGLFGSGATTVMNVNVHNSFMTGNGRDGNHVDGMLGATINLLVDPTDVSGNTRDGLFFNLASGSTLNATYLNDNLSVNGRSAVHGDMDASNLLLIFNNTIGNSSGEHGLFLSALNGSTATMSITDGTFADSSQSVANTFDGVHIESDASVVNLFLTNTPSNNTLPLPAGTQRHGMFLNIQNGSTFVGEDISGNLTNNLTNGLDATFGGDSKATLLLDNSPLDGNGVDGMHVVVTGTLTDAAITLQNFTTNDNNGQDGLDFNVDDGHLTVIALASSFTNSGQSTGSGNGILGVITNTGLVNLNFLNTPITGSFNNGMFVTATGGSDIVGVFDASSFNGNGLTTASTTELDGIRLVLDGSPASSLQLLNGSTVDGNGGDGFELIATNLTNFIGDFQATTSFSDNGQNPASLARRGVSATVNNSTVGLTFNGVPIVNNLPNATQQIGFHFDVRNAGILTADFSGGSLSDNTQNAVNGFVSGAGSVATVNLNGTVADRSGTDGAVLLVQAGGQLDFNLANASSINTSGAAGLVGTVDGPGGSLLNVSLDGSTIDASTTTGAFLNATAGGTLNFDGINTSSISNSGASGVTVTSTGAGSVANFNFVTMAINDNGGTFGGEGFNGAALNGGTLNVCLDNSSVSGNTLQGIEVLVTDPGSIANFGVDTSFIDGNGSEGLLVNVLNEGELNYRSQNSSYSNNGLNGAFDGVQATVTGIGAADTTTIARFLFSNDVVDTNTDDGFEFNVSNGATLVTSIANTSASNNVAGFGLQFNPSGAGTKAYLLMSGNNQFTGNGSGPINLNSGVIAGVDSLILSLSGSFDDTNGDGIHLELTDIANVIVSIQGPGTIDRSLDNGNGGPADDGDGIDIRMTNNTLATMNGSILIDGLTSIDDSAADGIHIEMTNNVGTFNGAVQISNIGSIANSGGDAIDISLIGMTMVNGLTFPTLPPVSVLTLNSSADLTTPFSTPLNACLPVPTLAPFDPVAAGLVPANALTINNVTADNSTGRGINVFAQNSTFDDNGISITNSVVSNSQAGDGLHFDFDTVTGPGGAPVVGLLIDGNGFDGNSGNGINFDLWNSPLDQLTITNNTSSIGVANQVGALVLVGDFGNDQGVQNTSAAGIDIVSVLIDMTAPDFFYDTVEPGASFPFDPDAGFGPFGAGVIGDTATTGLTSIDGQPVQPGTVPLADLGGVPYPGGGKIDDSHTLALSFNDFNPGEIYDWDVDMDTDSQQAGFISGIDLVVAPVGDATWTGPGTATVAFSTGDVITQPFTAVVGNPNSAQVLIAPAAVNSNGIASNGLDGVRFSLGNSTLSNLNMDTNLIAQNGGHGVNFRGLNGPASVPGNSVANVVNSNITGAVISNNTIDQNAVDGFHLVLPVTAGAPIGLTFQDNIITNQIAGSGIELQVNNAEILNVNIDSASTGNQISNNGSFGVHLDGQNDSQIHLTMGSLSGTGAANVLDANVDAGVGIRLVNATAGTIDIQNSTFSATTNGGNALFNGGGLEIRLADTAALTASNASGFSLDGSTGNGVSFADNAGSGFSLLLDDDSTAAALILQSISSLRNDQHQVRIERHADAIVNVTMNDSTLTGDATSLDGFSYNGQNFMAATPLTIALNRNTITANRDGVAIDLSANVEVVANVIENTISNNRSSGIQVTTLNASSFGNPSNGAPSNFLGNTINGNGAADGDAGIRLIASDVSFQNVLIGASAGGTRTTLSGNFDGIFISDASSTNPFSTPDNNYQIQATDIIDSVNDGIQLNLTGVGTRVYIGDPTAAATNVQDPAVQSDVVISRTVPTPGGTGHGVNLNVASGANNVSIRNATIEYSGLTGVNVAQTGGDLTFNMQATQVLFSGERGVFANITGALGAGSGTTGNEFNIGGTGVNEGVIIQNSGQQGILFRTQSLTSVSALRNLGTQSYPGGAQIDPNTPNVVRARLNIINSQVIANGTVGNGNSDGVVLAVGTNTQQDVLMAGDAINGNVLDDLRIFSFASLNTQNDSVDNPVAVGGPNDLLRLDPIARLGLVFGSTQSTYDSTTVPPITNPQTTPLIPQGMFPSQTPDPIVLATRNTGEQINVNSGGIAGTAGIAGSNGTFTTGGTFTNAGRGSSMFGQVQIGQFPGPGLSDTSTFADSLNQFIQFNIEQDLDGAFTAGGFNLNPANVFP